MICPICHKEIKDGSKFCGKCGNKIPRCPGCGEIIYKRTRFCVYDGTMLPEEFLELLPEEVPGISEDAIELKKKRKIGKIILKIILMIVVLLALTVAGIFGYVSVKGWPAFVTGYFGLGEEDNGLDIDENNNSENQEEMKNESLSEEDSQNEEEFSEDNIGEDIKEEPEAANVEIVHSYEVIAGDYSWQAAKAECENRGGYLATITSPEEYKEICELADNSSLTYLWLGALRYSDTDRWGDGSWITGEDWTFDYWYPGEPSLEDLDGAKEYYLCLWNAKYEGNDIGWTFNDQRNDLVTALPAVSGSVGYICEYENEVNII